MSDDSLVHYAEHCSGRGDLLYGAYDDGQMVGAAKLRSNSAIWSEQAPFGRHIQAEAASDIGSGFKFLQSFVTFFVALPTLLTSTRWFRKLPGDGSGSIVRVPASEIENRITRAVGTHLAVQAAKRLAPSPRRWRRRAAATSAES